MCFVCELLYGMLLFVFFVVFVYRCLSVRFVCDLLCDVDWFVLCVFLVACVVFKIVCVCRLPFVVWLCMVCVLCVPFVRVCVFCVCVVPVCFACDSLCGVAWCFFVLVL